MLERPRRSRVSWMGLLVVFSSLGAAPALGQPPADPALRERIIERSRASEDDAAFRRDVERLVGINRESEPIPDRVLRALSNPWVLFGFGAQALFMMRFVIQWIASERRRRSVVPVAFWWLSLAGGLSLLVYAAHRRDPVFVLGQGLGCLIYVRNLVLIRRRRLPRRTGRAGTPGARDGGERPARGTEPSDQVCRTERPGGNDARTSPASGVK